jgi:hypothetical protein
MTDPAINAVHKLIHRATKAETTLNHIMQAFATLEHGERVSLDNLSAPLLTALVRAEGAINPHQSSR